MAERQPSKLNVAGSIPVSRSKAPRWPACAYEEHGNHSRHRGVAHFANVRVALDQYAALFGQARPA